MKKVLLISSALIIAWSTDFAQTQGRTPAATTQGAANAKTEFAEKTGELATLLESRKTEEAEQKWQEINAIMIQELGRVKQKISEAMTEGNSNKQKSYGQLIDDQVATYQTVSGLKSNLYANRQSIIVNLKKYCFRML